ncbi:MAG: transposase [Phycisphaerae bacterium]|nr:transposase [Phycisphaerae bacterium]
MTRIARVVAAGFPHHVIQRGNRRQKTFFRDDDYEAYLALMAEWCSECRVKVWAYCLMPNHVHLIVVPASEDGLRRGIGEAHRRYSRRINLRKRWRGHLWQGRFASYVMDKHYLLAATRYVEMNPVKAGLVERPRQYRWSSARAHLTGRDDVLIKVKPLLKLVDNWRRFLSQPLDEETTEKLQRHERTGRPLGNDALLGTLEKRLDRQLRPKKPGRKPKSKSCKSTRQK